MEEAEGDQQAVGRGFGKVKASPVPAEWERRGCSGAQRV